MTSLAPFHPLHASTWAPLALLLLLLAAPVAEAQYKVIGGDGKVTYSDRPPNEAQGRVSALGARTPSQPSEADLPFELRQVTAKYPVTLYTTTGSCEPCAAARQLLKQRGIPYSERQVVTPDDSEALERISGGQDAPTLMVGTQALRGLAAEVWNSYLDAAGYPRESRLPATYQVRPATPIVERREPSVARSDAAPAAATPAPTATTSGPGGIRF